MTKCPPGRSTRWISSSAAANSNQSRPCGRSWPKKSLLAEGAWVTICGRSAERLAKAEAELGAERLHVVEGDVLDERRAARIVVEAAAQRGQLDGLAAIAGRGTRGSILELDPEDVAGEIGAKVTGFLNVVRPAIERLVASEGRVVCLTAPTARTPDLAMGAVSAGRSALDSILSTLAAELAPRGVRVNGVGVGLIDTPRQRNRHATDGEGDYEEWLQVQANQRGIPLNRPGRAEEVAAAVCWLLSPVSSYTTGSVVDVTGGQRSR